MEGRKEIKVIKVDGKDYAVGLFWQPIQDEKFFQKEIKNTVQTVLPGANLYVLRRGASSQYGLGFTSDKQKTGMISAAAAVANSLRDKSSAICVFEVTEGWWFTTIRNNLILSEEDTVYTSEEDARDAFNSMLSIPDWGYKIAPAAWGIDETQEVPLSQFLAKTGKGMELKRISEGFSPKQLAIGAAFMLLCWLYFYMSGQEKRKLEEYYKQQRVAQLAAEEEDAENTAEQALPKPWDALIDPLDFAKKCTALVVNSLIGFPGWNPVTSTCSEREMVANYRRTYGTVGWIYEVQKTNPKDYKWVSKYMAIKPADNSFNNVIGTVEIPMMRRISSAPEWSKSDIQKQLSDMFQSLKIDSFKFEDRVETVENPQNPSDKKNYSYTRFSFTDVSYRYPLDWVNTFSDIKSLEFSIIKWDNSTRKWSYEGKIYEAE